MTCFVATVTAYEGFNYASVTGTNPWSGGNTGLGFSTGWTISNTANANVLTGSMNFTNNGHALTTSGNSVTLKSSNSATQTLSTSVFTSANTLWMSTELSVSSTTTSAIFR